MASSQEEEHFARFALLMYGLGPRAVRIYFDSLPEFTPQNLQSTLQSKKTNIDDLNKRKIIHNDQRNLLFPNTGSPNSSTFDITLMVCLIRNLTKIKVPAKVFDKLPPLHETSVASDLARIKHYRNFLAHLGKNEIDGTTFHSEWSVISDAVGRLSGGSLTQECNDLKTKTLDQSNLNIMIELTNAKTEIDEIKKTVSDLKDGPIRARIDETKILMEQKVKENFYYPQTKAEDQAFEFLTQNRIVIVSGIEGSGKTTLAFHLMKKLADYNSGIDNDCIPVKVNYARDLQSVLDTAKDSNCFVILMDDPFGKSNYDSSKLDEWTQHFESLKIKLKEGIIQVIITTRHGILEAGSGELYKYPWLKESRINLSSEKWVLSESDKWGMVKGFCKAMTIDTQDDIADELKVKDIQGKEIPAVISKSLLFEISRTSPIIGFPQSCFLFFSDADIFKTGLSFFKNAREGLKNEISFLYSRSESTKRIYAILALMLLNGGQIELDAVEEDWIKLQKLNSFLGTNVDKTDLKNILNLERKFFRPDKANVYCFSHETILESILMSFCDEPERQLLLLDLAKDSLIKDFVRSSGYKPYNGEICVVLNSRNDQLFLSKLLAYYKKNCYSELMVVWHRTFQACRISNMFLELVEETNMIELQDDLDRMFEGICRKGHLPLLEGVLQRYGKKQGNNDIFISKSTLGVGLQSRLTLTDDVLILRRMIEHDQTLLDLKICEERNFRLNMLKGSRDSFFVPMISFAISSRRKKCVEYLLGQNIELKVYDDQQNNPLHYCARQGGWTDIFQELIKREPQLRTERNQQGDTPLMIAVSFGPFENVDILLDCSDEMSWQDCEGNTILHLCVKCPKQGPMLIHKILQKDKSLLNVQNNEGKTAIMEATRFNFNYLKFRNKVKKLDYLTMSDWCEFQEIHAEKSLALLSYGPDLTVVDNLGNNILHYCRLSMEELCVKVIQLQPELLYKENKKSNSPIMSAVENGDSGIVRLMLNTDEDLKFIDKDRGYTMLHFAARYGTPKVCEVIIEIDNTLLDVVEIYYGRAPLLDAAAANNVSVFNYLFNLSRNKKTDIHCVDKEQNSILHFCTRNILLNGSCSSNCIWLQSSVDIIDIDVSSIRRKNASMEVPLLYALSPKVANIMNTTYETDSINNFRWENFLHLLQHLDMFDESLLIKSKYNGNILHLLTSNFSLRPCWLEPILGLVLNRHPHLLNEKDLYGSTPMLNTSLRKHYGCTYTLLQHGADTSAEDKYGNSFRKLVLTDRSLLVIWIASMIFCFRKLIVKSLVELYKIYREQSAN